MCVMAIRDASDGMPKDFDRRLWHVGVIVSRTRLPKVFENPRFLSSVLHIPLWLHAYKFTQTLEWFVWS